MQQAISRDNDDAIPVREGHFSDELSCMILPFWDKSIKLMSI